MPSDSAPSKKVRSKKGASPRSDKSTPPSRAISELEAVVTHDPDDLNSRLIWADWLEEQGDPKGEWVRLQCQLSESTYEDRLWPQLVRQEHESRASLIGRLSRDVESDPIAKDVIYEFARGAVERIGLSAARWAKDADEFRARWPIRHVNFLSGDSAVLAKAMSHPATEKIRSLALPSQMKVAKSTAAFEAANFENLRHLSLRECVIGQKGMLALARLKMPHLRTLNLAGNRILDGGMQALVDMRLPKLEKINLTHHGLTTSSLMRFGEANVPKLRDLDLSGNTKIDELSGWPRLKQIHALTIGNCHISPERLAAALQPDQLPRLSRLSLRRSNAEGALPIAFPTVHVIAEQASRGKLRELCLAHQRLGKSGIEVLSQGGNLKKIRRLDLTGNAIDDDILEATLDSLGRARLDHLVLNANRLTSRSLELIAQAKCTKRLTLLDVSHNRRIRDEGAAALAESELNHLVWIGLDNTSVTAKGVATLAGRYGELAIARSLPFKVQILRLHQGFGVDGGPFQDRRL